MKENQTFKTRVKDTIIRGAKEYQHYFVEYDYLLCSEAFIKNQYYIIKGTEGNYKHLTGVLITSGSPEDFFEKSLSAVLSEDDFEIAKNEEDKSTKGTIRRKISVLEDAMRIFQKTTFVEEDFEKNNIKCSFATQDGFSTIGFTPTGKITRPKTLLKGNQLDLSKAKRLELVLRKKRTDKIYSEIIIGEKETLNKFKDSISALVDKSLFQ